MEFFVLLIPGILCALLVLVSKRLGKEDWIPMTWISLGISELILLITILVMEQGNFNDTEYLSSYYVKVRHTDKWDEYIHRTCTRQVPDGTDSEGNTVYREETYDCSYVETHPERWLKYDVNGNEEYIDREEFNYLRRLWHSKEVFVDMHRDYYTIDGDAQDYYWCGEWLHCKTFTWKHTYENRIQGSESVLKYREIKQDEAKELGLFEYPDVTWKNNDPSPILGFKPGPYATQKIKYLNSMYGKEKQIHVFILVWPESAGVQITEDQKAYWQGGNKNEFVICIGIDKAAKVKWANCFSWQDDTELDVRCRNWLLEHGRLDINALGEWIIKNLGLWKRKEFKDFSYIKHYLKQDQVELICWLGLIIPVIIFIIGLIILNNNKNDFRRFSRVK